MSQQETDILALRSSLTDLGGASSWNRSQELFKILVEIFPDCACAETLSQCLPDTSQPVVMKNNRFSWAHYPLKDGEMLYLSVYDASWFLGRWPHDSSDVLPLFAKVGFLPIADFAGGVFGLHRKGGGMGLRDTCLVYSEYGEEAFSDTHRFDFRKDLAEMMESVAKQVRSGSTNVRRNDGPF